MRYWRLLVLSAMLVGFETESYAQAVPPGSEVQVRAAGPFTVSPWDRGRVYAGYVSRDVYGTDGYIAIPRGSLAEFTVRQKNPDEVALEVAYITVDGNRYLVDSTGATFYMPPVGYENSHELVRTMMNYLAAAEGSDVDVIARGNTVRVTGDAVIRFRIERFGVPDQGYRERLYGDVYR